MSLTVTYWKKKIEQRNVEYYQFKQEKTLEVSNFKGNYYMSLTVSYWEK